RALDLCAAPAAAAAGALARWSDLGLGTGDDAMAAVARLRQELPWCDRRHATRAADRSVCDRAQSHRAAARDVPLLRRDSGTDAHRLPAATGPHVRCASARARRRLETRVARQAAG